jgi:hypothetical protein
MLNFFKKRMLELGRKKKISNVNKDIREELHWTPATPAPDENKLSDIGVAAGDNVIFSGAVDSYSDAEDLRLATPDGPGSFKVENDKDLAKFY